MSLVVTRIEVRNIRSIEHAVIDLDPDGITALVGSIGSGKSTVLEMIAWANWGTTPPGVAQGDLRRIGAETLPCSAEITMVIDGIEVRAVRTLTRKVGKDGSASETAGARLYLAGKPVEQITASRLTAKMTELTGLSGRMFRSMQFIGQAQLPKLAQGTASEIQALIEELTGITPLTKAIERASKAAAQAEQSARALPGDPDVLAQHEADLAELRRSAAIASERDFDAARAVAAAQEAVRRLNGALEAAQARRRSADAARAAADTLAVQVAAGEDRIRNLQAAIDQAGGTTIDRSAEAARAAALRTAMAEFSDALGRHRTAESVLGIARDTVAANERDLAVLPDVSGRLAAAQDRAQELHGQAAALRSAAETAMTQARLLAPAAEVDAQTSAVRHDADCPTCGQRLENPAALSGRLRDAAAALETQAEAVAADAAAAERELSELRNVHSSRERVEHNLATYRRAMEMSEGDAASASGHLQMARAGLLALLLGARADAPGSDLQDSARSALHDCEQRLASADRVQEAADGLAQAQAEADGLRARLAEQARLASDGPDPAETLRTAAALEQAEEAMEDARESERALSTDTAGLSARVEQARSVRDAEAARMDAKRAALLEAETRRASVNLLSALRKDLLADYTTGIADSASDLLSSLGCEHIAIALDETFLPRVIRADGSSLPLSQLSGGEQYRAAMCLRLGITAQIAGGGALPMVFGDEITAAYDAATREQVVAFLAALGMPMALVGHTDEVLAISSRSYTFSKPDDGSGSTARLNGTAPAPASASAVAA